MATNIQRWNDFFSLLDADQSGYLDPNDLKGAAAVLLFIIIYYQLL